MPRGFGRGFGGVWPYGAWNPAGMYGWGSGYGGYAPWAMYGFGRGRGNPFPFCRNFPWLPRWWWLYNPYGAAPYGTPYAGTPPYSMGYGHPYYSAGYIPPYGYPGYGSGYPGMAQPPVSTT